jgi:hypothetical protein
MTHELILTSVTHGLERKAAGFVWLPLIAVFLNRC